MNVVILENIRSAYNVGNIIRTADALWWQVRLTGYTPSPVDIPKVKKTSLGAENNVGLKQFNTTLEAIEYAKSQHLFVIAAEVTNGSMALEKFERKGNVAVIFGNEVEGVLPQTLRKVDEVVHIEMKWVKESLNVGQTTAIFMRELQ